jgi:hypothetical protein
MQQFINFFIIPYLYEARHGIIKKYDALLHLVGVFSRIKLYKYCVCVYVCMYVYIYIHTHTHTQTHTRGI